MPESPQSSRLTLPVLSVALPVPVRQTFDYLPPEAATGSETVILRPGVRIRVPFGNREMIGVLLSVNATSEMPVNRLKMALEMLDHDECIPPSLLELCQWAASYYQHPIGEVLQAALPRHFRTGHSPARDEQKAWSLTPEGKGLPTDALKGAKKQQAILQYLLDHQVLTDATAKALGISRSVLKAMAGKGLVTEIQQKNPTPDHSASTENLLASPPEILTDEQAAAFSQLRYHQFGCYLLEGATGSGKTEFYLQAIARVLQAGRQALILIPEIGLTPQTVERVRKRFHVPVAELHSNISDGQRAKYWQDIRSGHARIIIGTRLAALCPAESLGIIVIDEEHDSSFKQQDGFRYSARDISIYRAKQENIPIILGSATPSLETLYNAIQGRYERLVLKKRATNAPLPTIRTIDIKRQSLRSGLCEESIKEIDTTLNAGHQALVFINRRGFAPVLLCHNCGWTAGCPRCDTRFTLHKQPFHLHCHHCDTQRAVPSTCPDCRITGQLHYRGLGTEQMEETLAAIFSGTPIYRIDRDTTRKKGAMDDSIAEIKTGNPCILVGTQMLTKGHHLPKLALVVVADADQGLVSPDFRGPERMGQLITQVAGRAGRGEVPGKVLIQTHQPDHPLLNILLTNGYHLFARHLLAERQTAKLPPYSRVALFRAESKRAENAIDLLRLVRDIAARKQPTNPRIAYLGPVPAYIEKVNDRFRYQLQIKAASRKTLHLLLKEVIDEVEQHALAKRTRWSVDVDPLE